jgi:hypothetical protein
VYAEKLGNESFPELKQNFIVVGPHIWDKGHILMEVACDVSL